MYLYRYFLRGLGRKRVIIRQNSQHKNMTFCANCPRSNSGHDTCTLVPYWVIVYSSHLWFGHWAMVEIDSLAGCVGGGGTGRRTGVPARRGGDQAGSAHQAAPRGSRRHAPFTVLLIPASSLPSSWAPVSPDGGPAAGAPKGVEVGLGLGDGGGGREGYNWIDNEWFQLKTQSKTCFKISLRRLIEESACRCI